MRASTRLGLLAAGAVQTGFYLLFFGRMVVAGEVFHRLGFDWTMFWAQAMVLRARGGSALYDVEAMNPYLHQLTAYYRDQVNANIAQPVPYPPWFAALVVPFTLPSPPVGLALWYAASLLALAFLAFRARQLLPGLGFGGAILLMLASVPVATDLYMGQVALLLAIPVGEMLISFKARHDFRAGLWLAVLLIKPQYAVLFALLIVWKLRWRAIAGGAVGTLAFAVIALLTGGFAPFLAFPDALRSMADFQGSIGGPWWMINWRSIVLWVSPHVSDQIGIAAVLLLSLLTMGISLVPWRGRWNPDTPDFALRFCVLTLGALISSYHSHLHGAAILSVPLAAAWSIPALQRATRLLVLAALYLPTLLLMWTDGIVHRLAVATNTDVQLWYVWPAPLPAVLFVLAFTCMSLNVLGVQLPSPRIQPLRTRRTSLMFGGATCIVLVGILAGGVALPRLRAREALPDVFTSRNLTLTPFIKNLTEPASMTATSDRMFILERAGLVRVAHGAGEPDAAPVLDLTEDVSTTGEGGLLGLAFHNGYAYVAYTALDWSLRVVRYSDSLDAASAHPILVVPKQSPYDNGGALAFGPDGYLYIGVGDDQVSESAQDLRSLTGKILRVDVDSADPYAIPPDNPYAEPGARDEIWAYGLRNPAHFSFDRLTGDLWIGDVHHVGDGPAMESIELQPADGPPGENFGSPAHFFGCANAADCHPAGVASPVVQYDHNMNCQVTGGYVYRGASIPALGGAYIFGDYCTGGVFAVRGSTSQGWSPRLELGYQPIKISAFGEDTAGELYVVDAQGGTLYRIADGSLP